MTQAGRQAWHSVARRGSPSLVEARQLRKVHHDFERMVNQPAIDERRAVDAHKGVNGTVSTLQLHLNRRVLSARILRRRDGRKTGL